MCVVWIFLVIMFTAISGETGIAALGIGLLFGSVVSLLLLSLQ